MTVELKPPMSEISCGRTSCARDSARIPGLNTIIYIAWARSGDTKVQGSCVDLYKAATRAKVEQRAMFPLSGQHLWEILQITDPRRRGDLADILETLSDYNYLLGRMVLAVIRQPAQVRPNAAQQQARVRGAHRIEPNAAGSGTSMSAA